MAGILDLMGHIQQQGEMGRARGQQNKLAGLYSQAFSAPREQRQGLLSQIASVSPDSAQAASGMFDKMDDNARSQLGQYAAAFSALPDDQKAAAYPQLAQQAASLGLPVPMGEYQPAYAQGIAQLAQAFGGLAGGASGVQSTYVDAAGNRVAIMRDGSTRILGQNDAGMSQQTLTVTGPDGRDRQFTFDKRTGGYMPAQLGGTQPMGGEVPFSIDPRLPPEVQEAIRSHPDAGSAQGITSLNIPGGSPFVGRSPEEQAALTTAAQQQVELGFLPQRQAIETQGAIERTRGTEQAKAQVGRETEQRQRDMAFNQFQTAMAATESALRGTTTNPVAGAIPALTSNQQIAEGAVAAMAPILKQLFRAAGEGVFTDKDQELLMAMMPTRSDHPETITAKLANIRAIVSAKLGQGAPAAMQADTHPSGGVLRFNPATGDFE